MRLFLAVLFKCHPGQTRVVAGIKARWSQENYLKYMRIRFGLDRLIEYGVTPLPNTPIVINPAYRRLDFNRSNETGQP